MAQKLPHKDVVIIGFGWTGAIMAYEFTGAGLDVAAIERGAWHDTATGGRDFAGGRSFATPFGVLYSPNVTADQETGIGSWTDVDFIRAVHQGIRKDGAWLYPALPYKSYTLLTDADVLAIKAYILSLPPAHTVTPPNRLIFLFDQRALMGIWSAFYNPDDRFRPYVDRSAGWNRGAYLVEAPGHCGDCHTPKNIAKARDNRREFAGTITQGWRAYDITSDLISGLGAWSDAEISAHLHAGHVAGHGSAGGPMVEQVDDSLSALSPSDISAIVTYLRRIPAIQTPDLPAPRATPASDLSKVMQARFDPLGKQTFGGDCASCHGWSGVSPLHSLANLTGSRAVNDRNATNAAAIVISGERRETVCGVMFMPAFGTACSDTEIAAVANYVTARFGVAPRRLTANEVTARRRSLSQ